MPSAFYAYQIDYESPTQQDQEVVDYYNAKNITLYKNTWAFNITFSYGDTMEALEDVPTTDHQIEFHAQQDIYGNNAVHVRHAYPSFFFGLWLDYHFMWSRDDTSTVSFNWDYMEDHALDANASYLEVDCEHISMNFVIHNYNVSEYTSLEESWNDDVITVLSSYEIDFDAMKPSAFTLIAQLITFQNPDFGIPGDFGTVFNYGFAIGFWIVIAIIIYTLVTRIIPTIQGGIES